MGHGLAFSAKVTLLGRPYDCPIYNSDFINLKGKQASQFLMDYNVSIPPIKTYAWKLSSRDYLSKSGASHNVLVRYVMEIKGGILSESENQRKKVLSEIEFLAQQAFWLYAETELDAVSNHVNTINSMRKLYYYCLSLLPRPSNSICDLFSLLNAASEYYSNIMQEMISSHSFLSPEKEEIQELNQLLSGVDMKKGTLFDYPNFVNRVELLYHKFPEYSMIVAFRTFIEQYSEKYSEFSDRKKNYKTRNRSVTSDDIIFFWENPKAESQLMLDFRVYCKEVNMPNEQKSVLENRDVNTLAKILLGMLDKQLCERIKFTSPIICTEDGSLWWDSPDNTVAEYLCLYRDLMSKKQYRICPICKSLFFVEGKTLTKTHCKQHTRSQIEYYNRKKRALGSSESPKKNQ